MVVANWRLCAARLALLVLISFLIVPLRIGEAAELTVMFSGLRDSNGNLLVALYSSPRGFPDKSNEALATAKIPAQQWHNGLVFKDLHPGRYAVIVLHDEDGNGTMTTTWLGLPAEGFGTSNNPKFYGRPRFGPAAFDLREADTLEIKIRYF